MKRLFAITSLALVTLGVGCVAHDVNEPAGVSADAAVDPIAETSRTLTLSIESDAPGRHLSGALRLLMEEENTDQTVDRWLADDVQEWPLVIELESLPPGPIRLTVYRDRDENESYDPCPFPPDPKDPEIADTIDNISGEVLVRSAAQREAVIELRRSICGPGEPSTGIAGELTFPPVADMDPEVPIIAELIPVGEDEQGKGEGPMGLRIPLFPHGVAHWDEPVSFSIGELLPGQYRLVVFTDDDGDGQPSPCGPNLGGGDRLVGALDAIEITRGEVTTLAEAIVLMAKECPRIETGVTGVLSIDEQYAEMAADPQLDAPLGALRGPVIATVTRVDGSEETVSWRIMESIWDRPLPHMFTLTGLSSGVWQLRVFLDRDEDGRYTPCEGLGAGLDAVHALVEEVEILAGELVDVGELRLGVERCADEMPTGVSGRILLETEEGAVGSGRPVRLDLYPDDDRNEQVSVQLVENHWEADGEAAFSHTVAPGRYRALVYVDSNRDGEFTDCMSAPFGDRAVSMAIPLNVLPGQLVDLGELPVSTIGCPIPETEVRPILAIPIRGPGLTFDDLRIHLVEDGGWMQEMPVIAQGGIGRVVLPAMRLAPGQYRMTATLMNVRPMPPVGCERPVPTLRTSVSFHLDEMTPIIEPELRVSLPCNE